LAACGPPPEPQPAEPGAACVAHPVLDRLVALEEAWPVITPGVLGRSVSSYDRSGGNRDGFAGTYGALYTTPAGEHVLLDALGPGVLHTLWFTGPQEGGAGFDLGLLRFTFDNERTPRIEVDSRALFAGVTSPFLPPLVADSRVSSGGYVSWVPLPYASRLLVTSERRAGFYAAYYDTLPVGSDVPSYGEDLCYAELAARFAAALEPAWAADLDPVDLRVEGSARVHEHVGQGAISALRFEPESADPHTLHQARLRLYWDDAGVAAVDVPFDSFFGSGLGQAAVRARPFTIAPGVFESRLVMPFATGFRIEVEGLDGRLSLRLSDWGADPAATGRLHASHRREQPTTPGEDFVWLDVAGSGTLVGTVLTVRPPTPETKRWWEGDLRTWIDGSLTPAIHGTGHEDDHLGGWSNTFLDHPFTLPMHGEPATNVVERTGQLNGDATLYRLWPGLSFEGGIRHGVEHGSNNGVAADYEGVAFYYLLPGGPRLETASTAEGHDSEAPHTIDLALPADNLGCLLRKRYDPAHGRQRAAVQVDGRPLGEWYVAEGDTSAGRAERDLFLPPEVTAGRETIRVTVAPLASAPPWSAERYELLCVRVR